VLGVGAALVTVFFATTTGAIAAYYGGIIDTLIMRLADVILMLPFIPILIVLGALFEFQAWHLAVVFGVLSGFGGQNITIKAQALTIKVRAYIDAARVAGGSNWHIILVHLVPNLLPLAFLGMMNNVTGAISAEAALSFLGLLNIRISWGLMLQVAQTTGYLLVGWKYWYLMFPAGLSITLLSSAFYLVGRALDEVINPRLRRR
jgi:peptide/nickel transport system permease protein